jgi:hypothetical protein
MAARMNHVGGRTAAADAEAPVPARVRRVPVLDAARRLTRQTRRTGNPGRSPERAREVVDQVLQVLDTDR